ncbi:FtsX-like permease family protein [Actinoalloteichus caeruleus]|uniref:ABC-type transport system, involved in lipoprotein release, permease component n=1 Tax=Actinoalloteichus caeruleus DSM 43889 TaxID=1120930 RepID=A0ABT1JJT1_ACTCY|nr:FtsX-like permease family protein [Actinoalloteichus caeruleus]MCP2332416.1 ABC-type transport system, involved in lipoprotein release, permease component [Actinoalloteichus caeruleus DSM 43889]
MTATRLLFRLALRSLARRKARTALLVAAIFLPLTMAVTASVLATTSQPTAEAATEQRLGQAGALLVNQELVGSDGVDAALRSAESALAESLGREVPLVPEVTTPLPARLGDREVASYGHGLDLDEEIHQGRYLLVEGRHARRGGEVAVSVEVADRLDLAVGSTVQLGDRREEAIVTGIVSDAGSTTRSFVVVDVATAANHSPEATRGEENATGSTYAGTVAWYAREEIVQTPELAAAGWQVRSRGDALLDHGHPGSEGAGSLLLVIAAAVVAETTLVIFAVFTVVVRSTARESALLAAAGADPAARRRVVTYQGVLLGLAATVAAVLVGVLAARLLSDPFAASQGQIWGPIRLDPVQIGLLLLLGLSAPVVAARTAAEPAARLDVAAALHGGDLPGSSGGKGFRPALTAGLVGSALALASGAPCSRRRRWWPVPPCSSSSPPAPEWAP